MLRDVVDEGSLEGAGKNLFLVVEECLYAFVLQFAYYAALSLLSPALCSGARQPVHLRLSVVCRNPYTLYKKRSPTVVRIVERRGGICCCKNLEGKS